MSKKTIIGVCLFVCAFAFSASADQSFGFRHYFKEGVTAYARHDDERALRSFKIAQIYDPHDKALRQYLHVLALRKVELRPANSALPPEQSIGYRYYVTEGIKAFHEGDQDKAWRYLRIALIFNPSSKEAVYYLRHLTEHQWQPVVPVPTAVVPVPEANIPVEETAQVPPPLEQPTARIPTPPPSIVSPAMSMPAPPVRAAASIPAGASLPAVAPIPAVIGTPAAKEFPSNITGSNSAQITTAMAVPETAVQPATPETRAACVYVKGLKPKQAPTVISLAALEASGPAKPILQIELFSSVILEGRGIQHFLVVDEGFINVKILDLDHIEIDAKRIGTTFLHIWDSMGRHTIYVEVVFPKTVSAEQIEAGHLVLHSQPFLVTYSNDWSTYYQGKDFHGLKRDSYEFDQSLGITGETPYGFFDTSGSYTDFNDFSQFNTYTIGLSQIPLPDTMNFNLRGFDALRYMSPLTMPGTRMRGVFADVDVLDGLLGFSVSHGQEQVPIGFLPSNDVQFNNSYVDAVKMTLFPLSTTDRYSFNFATAYGSDHPSYLTTHVYSVEGYHAFNDYLGLHAEEASDSTHDSTLAALRFDNGLFRSSLNFRDIDKDYSTISTLPANQGETGVSWSTEEDFKHITASSFIEAYQEHLDPNPSAPNKLNYDGDGHVRDNINENWWTDTDMNFVDTPGEISPRQSFQVNQKLSRNFGVWNSMKGVVFGGAGYQSSNSPGADLADFNREDVIAGMQLPLTHTISSFANYEYDWLDQPDAGGNTNPSIINAGLEYQKQFNSHVSIDSQLDYRDELGVKDTNNSFLSGERSIIISSGITYNPTPNMYFFIDGDASRVISHINNPSYDDFEVHVGMRITFGGATYWDPLGTVSGIVFKDRLGNGKFGPGDEGIPGVKVQVGNQTAVTDRDGRYRVQVRARGVVIAPQLDTLPGGLLYSTPPTLSVLVFQGRTSHADFGLISQTGIFGIVFIDRNNSHRPNDKDQFVGKVRVILDGKTIQRSDSHGAFYFRHVAPGEHTLSIDLTSLALNMVPEIKLKNTVDVAEGTNYQFNIPVVIKQAQQEEE